MAEIFDRCIILYLLICESCNVRTFMSQRFFYFPSMSEFMIAALQVVKPVKNLTHEIHHNTESSNRTCAEYSV